MNKRAKRERAKAEERIRELREKYKVPPYPDGEEANPLEPIDGNRPVRRSLDETIERADREDGSIDD